MEIGESRMGTMGDVKVFFHAAKVFFIYFSGKLDFAVFFLKDRI
jgi:hypothetical protein